MALVYDADIVIKGIRCDWETVFVRQYLAERCPADTAETPVIYIGGGRLKNVDAFFAGNPCEVLLSHKSDGACANLTTP
jgi:hypothetical protein